MLPDTLYSLVIFSFLLYSSLRFTIYHAILRIYLWLLDMPLSLCRVFSDYLPYTTPKLAYALKYLG